MEEQVMDTGVETASAAEVQEVEQHEQQNIETNNEQTDTGVESTEVAAQNDGKDFAKALKAREEKLRQQLEKEYSQKAETYQQNLDRIAKFYGFNSHDEYMKALEEAEMNKRIQEEAEKLGVDEDVIRNHLQPLNQKLSEYEKKMQEFEQEKILRKVEAEVEQLSKTYDDFDKYKDKVFDIAIQKGYSLEDAYKLATYEDRINTVKIQTQQETIKNITQNAESSPGALGADAPEQASGYAAMSAAERRSFREKVKRGEL